MINGARHEQGTRSATAAELKPATHKHNSLPISDIRAQPFSWPNPGLTFQLIELPSEIVAENDKKALAAGRVWACRSPSLVSHANAPRAGLLVASNLNINACTFNICNNLWARVRRPVCPAPTSGPIWALLVIASMLLPWGPAGDGTLGWRGRRSVCPSRGTRVCMPAGSSTLLTDLCQPRPASPT